MLFPRFSPCKQDESAEFVKILARKLTARGRSLQLWEVTDSKDGRVIVESFGRPAVYRNQPLLQIVSKLSRLVLLIAAVKLQMCCKTSPFQSTGYVLSRIYCYSDSTWQINQHFKVKFKVTFSLLSTNTQNKTSNKLILLRVITCSTIYSSEK